MPWCGGTGTSEPGPVVAAAVKLVGVRLSVLCTGDRLPSESLLWLDGGVGGSTNPDGGSSFMLTLGKTRCRSDLAAASTMVGCLRRLCC